MKDIQLINWFPKWQGFKIKQTNPLTDINSGYYLIYKWFILFGFWELRKFMDVQERRQALKKHRQKKNQ